MRAAAGRPARPENRSLVENTLCKTNVFVFTPVDDKQSEKAPQYLVSVETKRHQHRLAK